LEKLCDKGVFKNENANVSAVLTKDKLISRQSRYFVEDAFGGSLPKFITSFFGVKERIKRALNFKKPSRVIIVAAIALAAELIAGQLTATVTSPSWIS